MRSAAPFCLAISFALAGCSTIGPGQDRASAREFSVEPYVRVSNADSNRVQLQIALREFVPIRPNGPSIWLSGVSHLGDPAYYAALQQWLDTRTLVLFEGISDRGPMSTVPAAGRPARGNSAPANPALSVLQNSLASALGLKFQLNAIDYRRTNFLNSDLSVRQLRQLMTTNRVAVGNGTNKPTAVPAFEGLLQAMEGRSLSSAVLQLGLAFLGSNAKFQSLARLALIEVLGELRGDVSRISGLPPEFRQLVEVLIKERNQQVLTDLDRERKLIGPGGSIAVFYGTGHMPDLETRLRAGMGYRPRRELWLTAFSVDLAQAGITSEELNFIHSFVTRQLSLDSAAQVKE